VWEGVSRKREPPVPVDEVYDVHVLIVAPRFKILIAEQWATEGDSADLKVRSSPIEELVTLDTDAPSPAVTGDHHPIHIKAAQPHADRSLQVSPPLLHPVMDRSAWDCYQVGVGVANPINKIV
jgi:hypothetical protein